MSPGSPLINAAMKGEVNAVRTHLHEATKRDIRGWTALMHAASRNFIECVKTLIPYERGLKDPQKMTALMIAADNGHKAIVKLLAKEELRLQDADGWTALMHTSYRGFDECAELLLEETGLQTTRWKDGMAPGATALMVAARFSRLECVELLRDREKGILDSDGHDALWYAENKGVNPIVKTTEVYRDPYILKLLGQRLDTRSGTEKKSSSLPAQASISQPKLASPSSTGTERVPSYSRVKGTGTTKEYPSPGISPVAAKLATVSPSKKLDETQCIPMAVKIQLEKTISDLQREVQSLQEKLASRDKEIQGLRAINEQMSINNTEDGILNSRRAMSTVAADPRVRMLQESLNQKNQEIDQLKAEIIGLREDMNDREKEKRDLRAQMEGSQNASKKKQKDWENQIEALRLESEERRKECHNMSMRVIREAKASEDKDRELKALKAEFVRRKEVWEDKENQYQAALKNMEQRHKEEVAALRQRMKDYNDRAEERVSRGEKEVRDIELALEKAKAEIAALRKENREPHKTNSLVTSDPTEQLLRSKGETRTPTTVYGGPRTRVDQGYQHQYASTGSEQAIETIMARMNMERESGQTRPAISHQPHRSPNDLSSLNARMESEDYRQREVGHQFQTLDTKSLYKQGVAASSDVVNQLLAGREPPKPESRSPYVATGVTRVTPEQTRGGAEVRQRISPHLEQRGTPPGSRSGQSPSIPSVAYQYRARDEQSPLQKATNITGQRQPSPRTAAASKLSTSHLTKTPTGGTREDVTRGHASNYGGLSSSTERGVNRDTVLSYSRPTNSLSSKVSGTDRASTTSRTLTRVSPTQSSTSQIAKTRAESHSPPPSRRSPATAATGYSYSGSKVQQNTATRSPNVIGVGAYSSGLYRRY